MAGGEAEIARLKRELRQAARQQRATSEMLGIISGSSDDLEPPFAKILGSAVRLCDADNGVINRWDGEALQLLATYNMPPAYIEERKRSPYRPDPHSGSGRMLATKAPVHTADLAADKTYLQRNPPTVAAVEIAGVRTALAAPMWKEGELIGSFTICRREVRPFTASQIDIVKNFATQAVVAVENTRLLTELRRSVAELRRERDNKFMNLEAVTQAIAHEIKQPLTAIMANSKAAEVFLTREPPDHQKIKETLNDVVADSLRTTEVLDGIRALFTKGYQGRQLVDMNRIVLDVLQSLRGELSKHGVTFTRELEQELPLVEGDGNQLYQVVFNLVQNGIDAIGATQGGRRELKIKTGRRGGKEIFVEVEDSGPGIGADAMGKIFEPFVTTKTNGTGLGLAISQFIVDRHSGQLTAASDGENGARFDLFLPIKRGDDALDQPR
jgi:C4-dicarboxylate-specific signal transduction histidine kinase